MRGFVVRLFAQHQVLRQVALGLFIFTLYTVWAACATKFVAWTFHTAIDEVGPVLFFVLLEIIGMVVSIMVPILPLMDD